MTTHIHLHEHACNTIDGAAVGISFCCLTVGGNEPTMAVKLTVIVNMEERKNIESMKKDMISTHLSDLRETLLA